MSSVKVNSEIHQSYITFKRKKWAALRNNTALTLSEDEIKELQGINENLSLNEVIDIYLPLSRMLNLYVEAQKSQQVVRNKFLNTQYQNVPYIIGIAGSVAVGKSTVARILQALLSRGKECPKVYIVKTDGFLYPNNKLFEKKLMNKKGFPESYDLKALIDFVAKLKSGYSSVEAPVYSHLTYDILSDETLEINQPDIIILEGLNVLQSAIHSPLYAQRVFVSDFVDFSIFVDADPVLIKQWYMDRFMKFRKGAFTDPKAYFHPYSKMQDSAALQLASKIWNEINGINLSRNIITTKYRATLILKKGINHQVDCVKLRK
ncbi:MAG: type I pantothenate kinase [Psychromonas sp.]|nr:type I pantothenate kinase [Psychromonas sp.]